MRAAEVVGVARRTILIMFDPRYCVNTTHSWDFSRKERRRKSIPYRWVFPKRKMIKFTLYHESETYKRMHRFKVKIYSDGRLSIKGAIEIHPEDPEFASINTVLYDNIKEAVNFLRNEGGQALVDQFFEEIIQTVPVDSLHYAVADWRKSQSHETDNETDRPDDNG